MRSTWLRFRRWWGGQHPPSTPVPVKPPVAVTLNREGTHVRFQPEAGHAFAAPVRRLPEPRLIGDAVTNLCLIRNRLHGQVEELKEIRLQIDHQLEVGNKARDALDEAIFLLTEPKEQRP